MKIFNKKIGIQLFIVFICLLGIYSTANADFCAYNQAAAQTICDATYGMGKRKASFVGGDCSLSYNHVYNCVPP